MTVRVVVADDQAVVRAGLRTVLAAAPDIDVVGEAGDGAEAAELAETLRPDVVLMDVRMPGTDGIEGTRRIRALRDPGIRVLVVTTFDLDRHVYDALRAGASGFVSAVTSSSSRARSLSAWAIRCETSDQTDFFLPSGENLRRFTATVNGFDCGFIVLETE